MRENFIKRILIFKYLERLDKKMKIKYILSVMRGLSSQGIRQKQQVERNFSNAKLFQPTQIDGE